MSLSPSCNGMASCLRQTGAPCKRFRINAAMAPNYPRRCFTAARCQEGVELYVASEDDMGCLASQFASNLNPGDCYCLYGDVGAGKSVWSRAFIRAAAQEPDLPVPSPTYLLQNTYDDHGQPPIHHFDLYRLSSERDLQRLDLSQAMNQAVCLFEWAERLESQVPLDHLAVHIGIIPEEEAAPVTIGPAASRSQASGQEPQVPDGTSSSGRHADTPSGVQQSGSGDTSHEDDVDETEEEMEAFSDRRSRRVRLLPHGEMWRQRLQSMKATLSQDMAQPGPRPGLVRELS